MGRIKVLLAEDHVVVRQGIRELIQREEDIEIVGEVGDGVKRQQILVVDREPAFLKTAREALEDLYEVSVASTRSEGLGD